MTAKTYSRMTPCLFLCAHLLTISVYAQQHDGHVNSGQSAGHGSTHKSKHAHGQDESLMMQEMVVTSSKIDEFAAQYPHRVISCSREDVKTNNYRSTEEVLSSMLGVEVHRSSGSDSARISIRGAGGNGRSKILVNGQPMSTSQYGGVNLNAIAVDSISRITVFKPPVPVWLGTDSSAGAIVILTEATPDKAESKAVTQSGELRVHGGSHATGGVNLSWLNESFLNGSIRFDAGAEHKEGERINTDRDTQRVSMQWTRQAEHAINLDLSANYYHSEHGSAGPVDNPTPDARQDYERIAANFKLSNTLNAGQFFTFNPYVSWVALEDKTQNGAVSQLDNYKYGARVETRWGVDAMKLDSRTGISAEYEGIDHNILGKHDRNSFSFFNQFDTEFGPSIMVSSGLRADYTEGFGAEPAANLSFSYAFAGHSVLKAGVGYTVNTPTMSQLYQTSHGSRDHVRGNPDLGEERVYSSEMAWEYTLENNAQLQIAYFREDTFDLIAYNRGTDLIYRPENISEAWRHGMEFTFDSAIAEVFELELSYILQTSRNRDNDEELRYVPHHKGKCTARYIGFDNTRLDVVVRAASSQQSDFENTKEAELDGYATADIKVSHSFQVGNMPADAVLKLENIFDSEYETHRGYPNDGFRLNLELSTRF